MGRERKETGRQWNNGQSVEGGRPRKPAPGVGTPKVVRRSVKETPEQREKRKEAGKVQGIDETQESGEPGKGQRGLLGGERRPLRLANQGKTWRRPEHIAGATLAVEDGNGMEISPPMIESSQSTTRASLWEDVPFIKPRTLGWLGGQICMLFVRLNTASIFRECLSYDRFGVFQHLFVTPPNLASLVKWPK